MPEICSPLNGTIVGVSVASGDPVRRGQTLLIIESMKMEHEVPAPADGRVIEQHAAVGEVVAEGDLLIVLDAQAAFGEIPHAPASPPAAPASRGDWLALQARLALTRDAARPEAVARRHHAGHRTARENVADLCDPGSFTEYGALAFAAQEARRPRAELIRETPADGLIAGVGRINSATIGAQRANVAVLAYDATVLAGTQGFRNHQKADRLIDLALQHRWPVVLFAEGGGGRPGDVDMPIVAGLHVATFAHFAKLAGLVPTVAVVAGRCFAGNAALAACCDVIIATRSANIGMAGPAMVEGGGLGRFAPEAIGPAEMQAKIGGVDLLVDDEAQAVAMARQCLAMLQGPAQTAEAADQAPLRDAVPENRLRVYELRQVLQTVFDTGSLIELQSGHGQAVITAWARLQGRAVAVLASNPACLGGAIDADAARKAAAFIRRADRLQLPVVSFIDTPGFMVGPQAESLGQVRASGDLFLAAAQGQVPWFSVVLRKAYGLGAMALAGGSLHKPLLTVAWPTGEFGAMGLEGAVRLGYRKELAAAPNDAAREALFQKLLGEQVERGQALNMAAMLEIDGVIDPADTRDTLIQALGSALPG